MRVLGLIVALAIILAGMLMGGSLMAFVNAPSILVVVGCAQGVLAALYGFDSVRIFTPGFSHQNPERGIRIAESGSHLYIMAGWVGAGIGWIQIGQYLGNLSSLGPAFAVSVLTIFYGYCAHFLVWYPIKAKLAEVVAEQK